MFFSLGITILELACDLDLPRGESLWHQLRSGQLPEEFLEGISKVAKFQFLFSIYLLAIFYIKIRKIRRIKAHN